MTPEKPGTAGSGRRVRAPRDGESARRTDSPSRGGASARAIAWKVLVRVERHRAYADLTLHAELDRSSLDRRDRAWATELTYGALRMRGRLDAALAQVIDRPLGSVEVEVRNLLRLGAYQVLAVDKLAPAIAVSETVELTHQLGFERATGFLNAVLRQLAKRAERLRFASLEEDPLAHVRDWGSLPEWLAQRWLDALGPQEAIALALASLRQPPRTVRVSPDASLSAVARRLGGRPCQFAPSGVTELAKDPIRDPGFLRGEFTVQDEASQLVPLMLGAQPGDRVVDCCAAPGTKAVQLAQQVGPRGEVIALDRHPSRVPLINKASRRLHLRNVRALQRDVVQGFDLQGPMRFRGILLDAPCSGLGTLRRNPDARWSLQPSDIESSAQLQSELLHSACRYVQPGGNLVYSVCTQTAEETEQVIDAFLDKHPDFERDDARPWLPEAAHSLLDSQGALRTFPHRDRCDGFFAQRLVRR